MLVMLISRYSVRAFVLGSVFAIAFGHFGDFWAGVGLLVGLVWAMAA
jgi:hypothetical protein